MFKNNEEKEKFLSDCEEKYYPPSESIEYFDPKTQNWYNSSGQQLRNPSEYLPDKDGCYTPFGDE